MVNTGATAGRVLSGKNGVLSNNLFSIKVNKQLLTKEYLVCFFKCYIYKKMVVDGLKGGANPHLGHKKINSLVLPLPPLAEQNRIVEKVDYLMTFCDNLEKELEKKVRYSTLSSKSVFNSIGNCGSLEELEETIRFIINNFKEFTLGDNGVKEFKNAILGLAVQGKLVPQDPNDEPAIVLLKKIKEEKEKLIKEGKLKKEKLLPPITENKVPYALPEEWKWVRLGDICSYIQRGKSPTYSEKKEIPVIAQKCIQWSGFEMYKAKFIDPETIKSYSEERLLKTGDLLWNSTGTGTLGRINIYYESFSKYDIVVADSHVTVIRPFKEFINYQYLFNWFSGSKVQDEIENKSSGSTNQIELSTTTIKEYLVPLPPLEEQNRIVDKVDSLMALCDELEKRIDKSKKYSEKLMESIVKNAFAVKEIENIKIG